LIAIALTPSVSPPPNALVDFARTDIDPGLPTQWAAVRTLVGEITDPVHSVCGARTATVNPQS
jgi:hypothetical protein